MNNPIQSIKNELNSFFLEREEEVDIILTALLSKQHGVFLGVPGTAKSLIVRAINSHIDKSKYFEWLLTKFTTPEEVFGVLQIDKLKKGEYERNLKSKLADCNIGFLDEIFKANSSILNSLLTIINERVYHNNGAPVKVPLNTVFGASNELPDEDENLEALYDRLLLRKVVNPIIEEDNLIELLKGKDDYSPKTKITFKDLAKWQKQVQKVDVEGIITELISIKQNLKDEGIEITDRRFKQSVKVVKAYAYLNGRSKANGDDLMILQYVYWTTLDQIPTVANAVLGITKEEALEVSKAVAMLDEQKEQITKLSKSTTLGELTELQTAIADIKTDMNTKKKVKIAEQKTTVHIDRVIKKAEEILNFFEKKSGEVKKC